MSLISEEAKSNLTELSAEKFDLEELVKSKFLKEGLDNSLYTNAYLINFKKDFNIYEYPFKIEPKVEEENIRISIFKELSKELVKKYGHFYVSGESFFAIKEVEKSQTFKVSITKKGKLEFYVFVNEQAHKTTITKGQKYGFSEIQETILYYVIREILTINPKIHFDRDNLYLEDKKVEIKSYNKKYYIHDGYKLSIQQTDSGLCLLIGIKNKIKGDLTVKDALNLGNKEGKISSKILMDLVGRRFLPVKSNRTHLIADIYEDRTPENTMRNHNGKSMTIKDFYKKVLDIEIKDKQQPLIIDKKGQFYVPELCFLTGISEEDRNNHRFMENLSNYTKLEPDRKIEQIEKCLDLFDDNEEIIIAKEEEKKGNEDEKEEEDNENKNKINIIDDEYENEKQKYNSIIKRREFYGIEIEKHFVNLKPYYIKEPIFIDGNKEEKSIKEISGVIPVAREAISTNKWLCLYPKNIEKLTYKLLNGFLNCSFGYNLKIENEDDNWIPMNPKDNAQQWIKKVENQMKNKDFKFVIFFIDNYELYKPLKIHSLYSKGYISQVIRADSLQKALKNKRGPNSYYSQILLQINNKLGGANYFIKFGDDVLDRKLMLIGIDTSHFWEGGNTGIAMISTKDLSFSKFQIREELLKNDDLYSSAVERAISEFITDSLASYRKENKDEPKNIIIYRQGIAHNQQFLIKNEAKLIENLCNSKSINYYYVLVNTYTSNKFFEHNLKKDKINKGNYKNPEPGLIVLDQITNKSRFEFYLQPQKVTQGSATPTYFHVAYGTMNYPELLIKMTFYSTFLYPNWKNSVRVPHVIKLAEKLSFMTAKNTKKGINNNLEKNLPHL